MWMSLERPWIVISGNPQNGFSYHGPFLDAEQANHFADMHITVEYDWWVAKLEEPIWDK